MIVLLIILIYVFAFNVSLQDMHPSYDSNSFKKENPVYKYGALIRTDTTKKEIHLVFTAHGFADGFETVMQVLEKHNIKGSFFLTGDFYRHPGFKQIIIDLKNAGHYLGAHSDKHILYASWENRDSTLVTKKEFTEDLNANYSEMLKFGIKKDSAKYFLPPFEWYNNEISNWTKELGLILINFTPGTSSNQDWTIPELGNKYISSDTIFNRILRYEETSPNGLNGFILLTHPGTDPRRTDKFYNRLDEVITILEKRGYKFTLLP